MKLGLFLLENSINNFDDFLALDALDDFALFKKRKLWLKERFQYAGEGDARVVYHVDDNKVIKLTKTSGRDQAQNEVKVFKCFGSKFVPKIYDFAPDFSWIISEKVTPFKTSQEMIEAFQEAASISKEKWDELKGETERDSFVLILLLKQKEEVSQLNDFLNETSSWYRDFISIITKCKAKASDVYEDNAGIASDGRFVVLDTGSFEGMIEEQNSIGAGGIVGYTAPLGAPGIGSSNKLEKGFWRDRSGKKVKTASPALHKNNKQFKETVQAVGIDTEDLNMTKGLWQGKDKEKVKTRSFETMTSKINLSDLLFHNKINERDEEAIQRMKEERRKKRLVRYKEMYDYYDMINAPYILKFLPKEMAKPSFQFAMKLHGTDITWEEAYEAIQAEIERFTKENFGAQIPSSPKEVVIASMKNLGIKLPTPPPEQ